MKQVLFLFAFLLSVGTISAQETVKKSCSKKEAQTCAKKISHENGW